ncbi:hypothetical protein [Chryseobacterium caseinilyticum]|uniref:Lipoprotein n=1 Tax=Chryseobacterium caseinilyticum TaxID=2771428 RepID=A0ABR8ZFH7_9FLAO|nr:hypothetical protein [Chryseobacterium caseinilyticum]MBD8084047.1 hypothetical protein [Chryseobacterium caseinilyticum]
MLKSKKYLILLTLLLCIFMHAQASGCADFKFKVKFDKDIPVAKIEVLHVRNGGNYFEKINLKRNIIANEIEFSGRNHYIVGAQFPLIVFSFRERKNDYYAPEKKMETLNFFYLKIARDKIGDIDKEIKFTRMFSVLTVDYKYLKEKIVYTIVAKESDYLQNEIPVLSELVKVNEN